MIERLQLFGHKSINLCQNIGVSGLFLMRIVTCAPKPFKTLPLLIQQIYFVGVLSCPIILVAALFVGMVIGLQGHHTLEKFAASAHLGQLLALSITRELGPVIAALLFAGRAGSALTAEIGLMRTTEQLDSMEMMAVDPIWRVIYPRFLAGILTMPLLAILFSTVAIYGGYFVGVQLLGIDGGAFWTNMQSSVDFGNDILNGIIKSIFFGVIITWIAVYQGFYTQPTAVGLSQATTRTVVFSSLAVLILDFILTIIMIGGW
ncbi:MAG: lipid asymmetry maintenance ABC transporter permease subunit MlaE [Gammaproteobacteria bacterium]